MTVPNTSIVSYWLGGRPPNDRRTLLSPGTRLARQPSRSAGGSSELGAPVIAWSIIKSPLPTALGSEDSNGAVFNSAFAS